MQFQQKYSDDKLCRLSMNDGRHVLTFRMVRNISWLGWWSSKSTRIVPL